MKSIMIVAIAVLAVAAACTTEKTVYVLPDGTEVTPTAAQATQVAGSALQIAASDLVSTQAVPTATMEASVQIDANTPTPPAIVNQTAATDLAPIVEPPNMTAISVGESHACSLRADGKAKCWGENGAGQSSPPQDSLTAIAVGDYHSCRKKDGEYGIEYVLASLG